MPLKMTYQRRFTIRLLLKCALVMAALAMATGLL